MGKGKILAIKMMVAVLVALLSIFVLAKVTSSPEFHAKSIQSLDEKKTMVLELSAGSALAATGVATIPGDGTTPIANKLTDISSYCLLIMCVIYLEKYLLTVTGFAAFGVIIPIACLLYIINLFMKSALCQAIVQKMVAFALVLFLVIPVSVQVSNIIESTHENSVEEAMEYIEQLDEEDMQEESETKGFLEKLFDNAKDSITDTTEKVKTILNIFIETVAIMIVTSCLIPIVGIR